MRLCIFESTMYDLEIENTLHVAPICSHNLSVTSGTLTVDITESVKAEGWLWYIHRSRLVYPNYPQYFWYTSIIFVRTCYPVICWEFLIHSMYIKSRSQRSMVICLYVFTRVMDVNMKICYDFASCCVKVSYLEGTN